MKLHDLRPDEGATNRRRRVGRGHAAGQGKTAGRGTKGQGARSGGGKGQYFEGGQLPLVRRLPFKRGFSNLFRVPYQEVNIDQLDEFFKKGDEVTPVTLAEKGLVPDAELPVVVLGRGELKKSLTVKAHRFTTSAREKLDGAGCTVEALELNRKGTYSTIRKLRKEQIAALREQQSTN